MNSYLGRKKWIMLTIAILFAFSFPLLCRAQPEDLNEVYILYQEAKYESALSIIDRLTKRKNTDQEQRALLLYWKGVCHLKLQQYQEAVTSYSKAIKLGVEIPSVHFELGLSYFASKRIEDSLKAFKASRDQGFKVEASTYYVAYLQQLLGQYDEALKDYKRIHSERSLRQAAAFQIGEILLARTEEFKDEAKKKEIFKSEVLAQYQKTIEIEPSTQLAQEAQIRLHQIQKKYFSKDGVVAATSVSSGQRKKAWELTFSQAMKYDTNVINQSENALIRVSNSASPLTYTAFGAEVSTNQGRWTFLSRLNSSYIFHIRRSFPRVYQNDTVSLTPSLSAQYAHTLFSRVGRIGFEYAFEYLWRDHRQEHALLYFNSAHALGLSEQISLFSIGPTLVQAKMKFLKSQDPGYDSFIPSFMVAQVFLLPRKIQTLLIASGEFQRADDALNHLYTYKLGASATIPLGLWELQVKPSVEGSVFNPITQRVGRGYEYQWSGGMELSKSLTQALRVNMEYSFTRRYSLDAINYAYRKQIGSLGIAYAL